MTSKPKFFEQANLEVKSRKFSENLTLTKVVFMSTYLACAADFELILILSMFTSALTES